MAAVTICSDFGAQENKVCLCFHCFPIYLLWIDGTGCHDLHFLNMEFSASFSTLLFYLIKRLFSASLLSASRVIISTYLKLLMFLPPILIPTCNSSSLAFLKMCSAYRLNKQGGSRQPCHPTFSVLNPSGVPYRVLTVVSWFASRFLRRQVRWSGISLRAFHSLLWSTQSVKLMNQK